MSSSIDLTLSFRDGENILDHIYDIRKRMHSKTTLNNGFEVDS